MPILNSRVQATRTDDAGKPAVAPSGTALRMLGPTVQITIAPLDDQLKSIAERGEELPAPMTGMALIDTGASDTCIDRDAATTAGLAVVDSGPMHSATHADEIVPIFAGRLNIQGLPHTIDTKRAYGVNLAKQKLIALIGRDVLAASILVYNGPDDSFSLSL